VRKAATETKKVGIREFRENLASYVLESDGPVAITRHGDTVGLYIPVRRKRTEAEKAAFGESHARVQKMLAEAGLTEDDVVEDFKKWRAAGRRK
jgi:antitoxin (DNA-binding transcriptional repressor) of toxin-antitoxin stability system